MHQKGKLSKYVHFFNVTKPATECLLVPQVDANRPPDQVYADVEKAFAKL